MLDKLQSADFTPHLNETFYIQTLASKPLTFELIDVAELGPAPADDNTRRRPFSIVFRGPMDDHLPQRIYTLENFEMGSMDLFLVPIGRDGQGMRYEAVFT
jgi:hypothetical protein